MNTRPTWAVEDQKNVMWSDKSTFMLFPTNKEELEFLDVFFIISASHTYLYYQYFCNSKL
jgi:hypothetical protein